MSRVVAADRVGRKPRPTSFGRCAESPDLGCAERAWSVDTSG